MTFATDNESMKALDASAEERLYSGAHVVARRSEVAYLLPLSQKLPREPIHWKADDDPLFVIAEKNMYVVLQARIVHNTVCSNKRRFSELETECQTVALLNLFTHRAAVCYCTVLSRLREHSVATAQERGTTLESWKDD